MEGNSVIDGDVGCNSNDDDDSTSNPETALSYFDEKIQSVLGHFQKDFEGGVFADNLGAKYGGYGSFLLSCDGSPCRESNENNCIQISNGICPTKEMKQHTKIPVTFPKPATELLSSMKHAYLKLNAQSPATSAELKSGGNTIVPKAISEQRSLKLRIKVGSNGKLKTPTIDIGVGPNKSCLSTNDHSVQAREKFFKASNSMINESPATMLRVMASFPVKDAPLSPLPESILCFIGKESCNNDSQENNNKRKLSLNKASSSLTKRKNVSLEDSKLRERSVEAYSSGTADVIAEKCSFAKETGRQFSQNISLQSRKVGNKNPLEEPRSDLAHSSCRQSDVFHGIKEDGSGERTVASRKEERDLKPSCISDNIFSSAGAVMSKKNLLAESTDKKAKKMKFGSLSNGSFTSFSPQKDAKGNRNRSSSLSVDDEANKSTTMKRKYSPVSSSEIDKHESFMTMTKKQAMNNENVNKVKNSYKSLTEISRFSKSSEQSDISEMDLKSSAFSSHKSKMKFDDDKGTPEVYRKNIHDSERPLIEDKWVMCDICEKWRLLPYATNPEKLPEKWLCSMLDWLPGMNRCDISEEETTKALCAQYQISPDVVLTYHQNYKDSARGFASAIKENKRTYHEKSHISAKSLTRDCPNANTCGGTTQSSKSALNNAQVEMRTDNRIVDDSSDEFRVQKTKKTVLHDTSDVSRNAREISSLHAKGIDRTSGADSFSQQKSKSVPNCSKNEPSDSKQRILVSLKVRESKPSDAKPADLRVIDFRDSEVRSNEKRNIRKTHAVCDKVPRKAKCADKLNVTGDCNDSDKKKTASVACSSASKAYECHDKDNSGDINPVISSKASTDEKVHRPSNSNKDAAKCPSIIAEDDSDTRKETSKSRITDRRIHTTRSPAIASDTNISKPAQARGNGKALKKNEQHKDTQVQAEPSDLVAVSPPRATSSTPAASEILKEAQILRDRADSFRDSGFGFEGNETYFEAAIKFLHGAYLLESSATAAPNNGDITQFQAYNTAAQLCGCCSKEYERLNDMATSALAYKCMEVAYWNMVYCRNSASIKDRTELQASLQQLPPGDSPSSSASDVDNLNNGNTKEKAVALKGSNGGSCLIPAKSNSHFVRLLDYTRDVNAALECSKKAQRAFLAAEAAAEKAQKKGCLSSVKSVLNHTFQGVDTFVKLLRVAMKDVNRSALCVAEG